MMLVKSILCICIQALLYKAVVTQCIPPCAIPREPLCESNYPAFEGQNVAGLVTPMYGRIIGANLMVDTSAPYAPIGPAGVSIFSDDLIIEGTVFVTGKLPFLGTVGLEGVLPTTGTGSVNYECGAGDIGIVNDGITGSVTEVFFPVDGAGVTRGNAGCNTIGFGAK
ncbi:hypothetical protein B5X24_HaOG202830 [Helicoverpa armigera]|nr:hypothetical protein B5X24_HaOG202830 [Helicoverpa armigera]